MKGGHTRQAAALLAVAVVATLTAVVPRILTDATEGPIPFEDVVVAEGAARPANPHSKTIGDLDGDGRLDIVVASSAGGPMVWYRSPDGSTWPSATIHPAGSWTTDMQAADVDGDGDLDVVAPKSDGLRWYENPLPATSPRLVTAWVERLIGAEGANSHDVEVGDVDGDGRVDVVTRPKSRRDSVAALYIWRQTPIGWVNQTIELALAHKGEGLALGDIDRDGDLDIAANGYWLENQSLGTVWSALHTIDRSYFHPVHVNDDPARQADVGITIADVTGDGADDVLIAPSERFNGYLALYEHGGSPRSGASGGWARTRIDTGVSFVHTFRTADMDRDGDLDIVAAEMHQTETEHGGVARVLVYLNPAGTGATEWTQQVVSTLGSHNIRLGDFDDDGDVDIVGANWQSQGTGAVASDGAKVHLWRNLLVNGPRRLPLGEWQRHVAGEHDNASPAHALFVRAADLDADGSLDLVTGPNVFFGTGAAASAWSKSTVGDGFRNVAAVHDIDGDGKLDLVGTDAGTVGRTEFHQLVWARNNGDRTFTVHPVAEANDGDFLQGIAVGRFAGGTLSIALSWHRPYPDETEAESLGQQPGIYLVAVPDDPAAGGAWSKTRISSFTENEELSAGDVDRDGRVDLLLGTSWLRNAGASWDLHTLFSKGSGDEPDRNRLSDIDLDGRLDAVVGYESSGTTAATARLAWYRQPADATDPWTETVIDGALKGPMSVDVSDFDGDGDDDVVVGEHDLRTGATPRLLLFENRRDAGFRRHLVHAGDEHHDGALAVDVDGDGDVDVASIGFGHRNVLVYENLARGSTTTTVATTTTTAPSTTTTASTSTTVVGGNLAPNPSFESDPAADYFTHGPGTFSWATDAARTGGRSVKIVSSSTTSELTRWLSVTKRVTAVPGRSYRARVFVKTAAAQSASLAVNFWNASSQHLKTVSSTAVSGTADWRLLSVEATAPATTGYVRVELRLKGSGTVWFDDVEIVS